MTKESKLYLSLLTAKHYGGTEEVTLRCVACKAPLSKLDVEDCKVCKTLSLICDPVLCLEKIKEAQADGTFDDLNEILYYQ